MTCIFSIAEKRRWDSMPMYFLGKLEEHSLIDIQEYVGIWNYNSEKNNQKMSHKNSEINKIKKSEGGKVFKNYNFLRIKKNFPLSP